MYQNMSIDEKIEFLTGLEEKGFEWAFAPINGKPYGLTKEDLIKMKRQDWEDNYKENSEMTFEEWFEEDINSDDLLIGINHELSCLTA